MPVADLAVDGTIVKVEFEAPPGQAQAGFAEDLKATFAEATDVLGHLASAFTAALRALPAEQRPKQASLTFGLKVGGEANWVIAKASAEGSFQVTLSWDRSPG